MSRIANLTLRGLEFIFTLLIMALVGNMIATAFAGNPAIINYNIFVSVFSMLSLFYLIVVAFNDGFAGHPAIPLVLDGLNTIFFFCGAVPMSAYLHVHSCNDGAYLRSNFITNGAGNMSKRCREAQATTAFLWFGFACYVGSLIISALGSRGGVNMRGGIRKGPPAMSQV